MPRTKAPAHYEFPIAKDPIFLKCTPKQQKFIMGKFLQPMTGKTNLALYQEAFGKGRRDSNETSVSKLVNSNEKVKHCLSELAKYNFQKCQITAQQILNEEKAIAFSDIAQYWDEDGYLIGKPADLPEHIRKAISAVQIIEEQGGAVKRYKVKLWNKGDSLGRLQKIQGMIAPTKLEHSGPNGKPIDINVSKQFDFAALNDDELITFKQLLEKARC